MNTTLTEKEIAALDKKIESLKPKVHKAHQQYETLLEQLSELIEARYPERQEDAIKERLWKAYKNSNKDIDLIIDYIENGPDDDDYWN